MNALKEFTGDIVKDKLSKTLFVTILILSSILFLSGFASATVYECDSCDLCSALVTTATTEDVIRLNQSISNDVAGCIVDNAVNDISIDCNGYNITSSAAAFGGVNIISASNVSVYNCGMMSGWDNAVLLYGSIGAVVENCTMYGNSNAFYVYGGNVNIIRNNMMTANNVGVIFEGDNHIIENNIITANNYGFAFYGGTGNIFRNNIISDQIVTGTTIISGGNFYYNNIFNNTENVIDITLYSDNWNTTKSSSINIMGGANIGGNYWSYPNGTGYSQLCNDTDFDGICDDPYIIDDYNTDYLALSNIPAFTVFVDSPQSLVYTNANIPLRVQSNRISTSWWYSLNGGSNVVFVPNTTIVGSQGLNSIVVYALNDSLVASTTVLFIINSTTNSCGSIGLTTTKDTPVCISDVILQHNYNTVECGCGTCYNYVTAQNEICQSGCSNNECRQASYMVYGMILVILIGMATVYFYFNRDVDT
jgi:parallel beta-helix repeat protein